MTCFSFNVNKIALLRNSRGQNQPNLCHVIHDIIDMGVTSITIHPREDERHITRQDIVDVANIPRIKSGQVALNIEGDLRPDLLNSVMDLCPTQFTIVPVTKGEITSNRGIQEHDNLDLIGETIQQCRDLDIKTSIFVDPTFESVALAHRAMPDAVEIYTGDYAKLYEQNNHINYLKHIADLSHFIREKNMFVHAGHDLNLHNLADFLLASHAHEVSIGHAIFTEALYKGLSSVVKQYLALCQNVGLAKSQ